jgi:hypothetical protein
LKDRIKESTISFIDGYAADRPDLHEEFFCHGPKWAKAMNFSKLLNISQSLLIRGADDPHGRTEPILFNELVKFIAYLRELDVMDGVFGEINKSYQS